jgi:hypothetical protein
MKRTVPEHHCSVAPALYQHPTLPIAVSERLTLALPALNQLLLDAEMIEHSPHDEVHQI